MTQIRLMATDQLLTVVEKPKIASGDVNTVEIHVDFDETWNFAHAISAVFYTNKNDTVYEVIMIDGDCMIPHEALAEDGVLYIGVRGIIDDQLHIKTSTLVKYKIEKGAPKGTGTSVEPTADVYQQLLAAYGVEHARINALLGARTDATIKTHYFEQTPYMENWNCHAYIKSNGINAVAVVENFDMQIGDLHWQMPEEFIPLGSKYEQNIADSVFLINNAGDFAITNREQDGAQNETFEIVYPLANIWIEELDDIRVGADGTEYDCAGDAVRAQIDNLNDALSENINEVYDHIEDTHFNSAIKGNLSGAVVRADDVSPVEHFPVVKVHGKNLIPYGTITFTRNQSCLLDNPLPAGTYTISAHIISSDTDSDYSAVSINSKSEVMKYIALKRGGRVSSTFTATKPITNIDFCAAYNYSQGEGDSATWSDIQLEEGSVSTDYEPYKDTSTVTVKRGGKNLLNLGDVKNGNGTTSTNNNGKFTVTGYFASVNTSFLHSGERYTVSFDSTRTGEAGGGLSVEFYDETDTRITGIYKQNELSTTISFTVPEGTVETRFYFYGSGASAGTDSATYTNVQLEYGNEATEYEPYNCLKYTPSADGTVEGIFSLSPNMTIITDTEGAIVECEYIKDTNKVIQKIADALGITI